MLPFVCCKKNTETEKKKNKGNNQKDLCSRFDFVWHEARERERERESLKNLILFPFSDLQSIGYPRHVAGLSSVHWKTNTGCKTSNSCWCWSYQIQLKSQFQRQTSVGETPTPKAEPSGHFHHIASALQWYQTRKLALVGTILNFSLFSDKVDSWIKRKNTTQPSPPGTEPGSCEC